MPTLLPAAFVSGTNTAFVWTCSDCDAVFSLEYLTNAPSVTALQKINSNFETHCRYAHPKAAIAGLEITLPLEDSSQSAVRVVRESTHNK